MPRLIRTGNEGGEGKVVLTVLPFRKPSPRGQLILDAIVLTLGLGAYLPLVDKGNCPPCTPSDTHPAMAGLCMQRGGCLTFSCSVNLALI